MRITNLLLACVFGVAGHAYSYELSCKVVGVTDGDTITCLTADRNQAKVRLQGIDAPESKQPFGQRSKQNLSALVYGKPVTVRWYKRDRWKRILGAVWVTPTDCPSCGHTLDAGAAQLTVGMAWWFRRYANEQSLQQRHQYEFEETAAKARKAGLWVDASPIAPWDWRKGMR